MNTNVIKIHFKAPLVTALNENGEEKKNIQGLLPYGWNKETYTSNKDCGFGYAIKTGKVSNLCALDCDSMESYEKLCKSYPDIHKHYTVKTRRGFHIYFKYDCNIKSCSIPQIDFQSDSKLIIGPDTNVTRYDCTTYRYEYMSGIITIMPDGLKQLCVMKTEQHEIDKYHLTSDYVFDITDEECRGMLDELQQKHEEYFLDYNLWLKLTTVMKTINQFALWDEFNKKYNCYDYSSNVNTWNSIKLKISPNFLCKLLKRKYFQYHKVNDVDVSNNDIEVINVNQKHVNISLNTLAEYDLLILDSKTGTGKSTCSSKLMKHYLQENPKYSILCVVNLISLADQTIKTFHSNTGIKLLSYQEKDANESSLLMRNSVICVNSLIKLCECDFSNKIVYIDEIRSLTYSLTHNQKLKNSKLIDYVLKKIIRTCHKLIVSDAHITQGVMQLLEERITATNYIYYANEHNKFQDVKAIEVNDESKFLSKIKNNILNNEPFSFACDSATEITKYYNSMYAIADPIVRENMILYTAESQEDFCDDWKDKFIFYSPKITTGVDINVKGEQRIQYIHVSGNSVDAIGLLQMSTRTRNMEKLYMHFSNTRCKLSTYKDMDACFDIHGTQFCHNKLAIPREYYNDLKNNSQEAQFLSLFITNEYQKDLCFTNIKHFYLEELKTCGFDVQVDYEQYERLNKSVIEDMKQTTHECKQENVTELCAIIDDEEKEVKDISNGNVKTLAERCDYLQLDTSENISKYSGYITDKYIYDQVGNFKRLMMSEDKCEDKLRDLLDNKFMPSISGNVWNKIKYVHLLKNRGGIKDVFDIENLQLPVMDKYMKKIFTAIDTLYRINMNKDTEAYTIIDFQQLYGKMLKNLVGKLGLFESRRFGGNDKATKQKKVTRVIEEKKKEIEELIAMSAYTTITTEELIVVMNYEDEEGKEE